MHCKGTKISNAKQAFFEFIFDLFAALTLGETAPVLQTLSKLSLLSLTRSFEMLKPG